MYADDRQMGIGALFSASSRYMWMTGAQKVGMGRLLAVSTWPRLSSCVSIPASSLCSGLLCLKQSGKWRPFRVSPCDLVLLLHPKARFLHLPSSSARTYCVCIRDGSTASQTQSCQAQESFCIRTISPFIALRAWQCGGASRSHRAEASSDRVSLEGCTLLGSHSWGLG